MLLLLVLPVLVSGFLLFHFHPYYKYKLHRYEGQYLYLRSAQFGLYCFLISIFIDSYAYSNLPASVTVCSFVFEIDLHKFVNGILSSYEVLNSTEVPKLAWILVVIITSLVVPLLWSGLSFLKYFIRYWTLSTRQPLIAKVLSDSPLDAFLFEAMLKKGEHLVMLSLSDRKVYVGKILSMGEPNESEGPDQEVLLKPVMSGYRKTEDLTVEFTTSYNGLDEDTFITIRQDLIVSACEFKFDTYENLNPKKEPWSPV
ncbi:hypothetical protein SHAQ108633_08390 [Shewanella aquimarina]